MENFDRLNRKILARVGNEGAWGHVMVNPVFYPYGRHIGFQAGTGAVRLSGGVVADEFGALDRHYRGREVWVRDFLPAHEVLPLLLGAL